ncbi:hypothetical protein OG429_39500 [Streptomyces sp. NBC_00190]|uniref:DUF6545 domain-containing protein n=1 Tax=unclassified Streptomyces TaxID=2593676 RepID=UPI002E2A1A39|nr:DUF6545 domain-containing protein [Streptomyces sp. NBC_00190]WSZ37633.1 hypothetical protein OG239_01320 [Streptomyces sp. NBC_00868]
MSDIAFYLSGGLLLLACLLKMPALLRARGRDWLLFSICALLLVGGGVLVLSAEGAVVALRRLTGVTNVAVPLIYILLTACSGSSIVLVLNWRGPDVAQTRRLSRITIAVYGTICAVIAVLFVLGDTPVERRTDFDTYYATTPFIREMIVLYVVAHALASLTASRLCWRWSHDVHGTLRVGLRVLSTGYLLHYGVYDPAVAGAVVARWMGHDWGVLIEIARGVTAPSAVLVSMGFLLPLVGHHGEDAIRYWRLAPLARAVAPVRSTANPIPVALSRWRPAPRLRLTQRHTYIGDRLVTCVPHFDVTVQHDARSAALARGATGIEAAAIADAAVIIAAVERRAMASRSAQSEVPPSSSGERAVVTSDLARISRALRSPIVRDARRRARTETDGLTGAHRP